MQKAWKNRSGLSRKTGSNLSSMSTAILREVSSSLSRCELTHIAREPIDVEVASAQHRAYERLLRSLGCSIVLLPEEPEMPDAVFVEDTAIVLRELAIITRPGAVSRRPETSSIAAFLARYRQIVQIEDPGTIDGGDVLLVGRTLFIGQGGRSNSQAIDQVTKLLRPLAYKVQPVPVNGCLHLKSAATLCGSDLLLVNPAWVDPAQFGGSSIVEVDPAEPHAANALLLDGGVIFPTAFPRTAERLRARNVMVHGIDLSELAKAEGAVTCCSLILDA
jgi:dimethylargininase